MRGGIARTLLTTLAGALACAAAPVRAESRVAVEPYLELDQTFVANLKGADDDLLTYTTAAAGVDARVTTRDAEAQVNLRYEHQFGWGGNIGDQDVFSGLARARANLIRDELTVEGGAIATRIRSDLNGANGFLGARNDSIAKIYSGYVGPTLTTRLGDLDVSAAYRLGYTKVQDDLGVSVSGGPAIDAFDESVNHSVIASVGMQPGRLLPVGWTASAGYDREDATQLDQRFDDKWARLDLTLPVSPTLAILGGAGYEDLEISQRDLLRDPAGNPVLSPGGHYVTDDDSPRQLAYDQDGLIWDVGVLWRPSRRTSLEARVGRRYGSMIYTGSFSWQPDRDSAFTVSVYDGINSFGRMLNDNLAGLATNFNVIRNPFSGDLGSCVYAAQGGGACFNDALSALGTANFRNRGVTMQYSRERGPWSWGAALGYARRTFIAPDGSVFSAIDGVKDENYYLNLFMARKIDDQSGVDATLYANYFDAGLDGNVDVLNAGAYASYYRNFTRRLIGTASLGLDGVDPKGLDSIISALAQLGLRYQF